MHWYRGCTAKRVARSTRDENEMEPTTEAPKKKPVTVESELTLEKGVVKFMRKPAKMGEDFIII